MKKFGRHVRYLVSGRIDVRIIVSLSLLMGLFCWGCQTPGSSDAQSPKTASTTLKTGPSEVQQPTPNQSEKRTVVQEPQPVQTQPAGSGAPVEKPAMPATTVVPVAKEGAAASQGQGQATVKTDTAAGSTAGAVLPQGQIPSSKGPRIIIEKTEFDMGEISTNGKGTATFKWTNAGDATLEITDVQKCCGANVQLEKQKLEPGESGGLSVEYRTDREAGQFKKDLTVHSNDQTHPAVRLTILGKVIQRLIWKPTQLKLFLNKENLGCGNLIITAVDGKPFSIDGYLSTEDCITIEYDPNVQATEFVLKPKVNAEKLLALDYPKGTLHIGLTRQDYERIALPFDLLPNYTVTPTQFILFNAEPGKKETRKVMILDNYVDEGAQSDFTVESVTSQNRMVSLTTTKKTKDGFELVLEINPAPPQEEDRSFSDEVIITIKGGDQLKVNLKGFYAAKVLSGTGSTP